MVKTAQKKKDPEVYEIDGDSLESFRACGLCGTLFDSEISDECPQCHGKPGLTGEGEPPDEPEDITCPHCGVKLDGSKVKVSAPFFGAKGRRCPVCESLIDEAPSNPNESGIEGVNFIDWDA